MNENATSPSRRPGRLVRFVRWCKRPWREPDERLREENAWLRDRLKWFEAAVERHNDRDSLKRIWVCECGSNHYLKIHRLADPKYGLSSYVTLESASTLGDRLIERLKMALRVLGGGDHEFHWAEILLSPESAREIARALETEAAFDEAWTFGKDRLGEDAP